MKRFIARSILFSFALAILIGFVYMNVVHFDRILPIDAVFGGVAVWLLFLWSTEQSGWFDLDG